MYVWLIRMLAKKHKIYTETKKARFQLKLKTGFKKIPGGVLLSHPAAQAVPSAQKSLTSVFEMGTGVAPSP